MQNKLTYGDLLSPYPIKLTIGILNKPTLKDIAEITFTQYDVYRYYMNLTPEKYYCEVKEELGGAEKWESMNDEQKENLTIYKILLEDELLQGTFTSMFNFFFKEEVIYEDGVFLLLADNVKPDEEISIDLLHGYINEQNFNAVMSIIMQISCVKKKETESDMKFKNELARKLYYRMKEAQKKEEEKANKDFLIPNIISAVTNKHPSINVINVWELTVYQLLDIFERLRINAFYDIQSLGVSVWGDENNKFKENTWYQNNFDAET